MEETLVDDMIVTICRLLLDGGRTLDLLTFGMTSRANYARRERVLEAGRCWRCSTHISFVVCGDAETLSQWNWALATWPASFSVAKPDWVAIRVAAAIDNCHYTVARCVVRHYHKQLCGEELQTLFEDVTDDTAILRFNFLAVFVRMYRVDYMDGTARRALDAWIEGTQDERAPGYWLHSIDYDALTERQKEWYDFEYDANRATPIQPRQCDVDQFGGRRLRRLCDYMGCKRKIHSY
jgi:hypothetical protein